MSMSMIDPASYDAKMSHSLFGVLYVIGASSWLFRTNGASFDIDRGEEKGWKVTTTQTGAKTFSGVGVII